MRSPELTVASVDGVFVHTASNTNQLLGSLEGIVWGKTGNTDGALGCMLLVVKMPQDSDTLVSIVLGSQARFDDTELLVNWARDAYTWH
jgi:D-alanyl-D-alanine carboxypeptidase